MPPRVRLAYLAAFVVLFIVGLVFNLPFWLAVVIGVAAMIPVATADVVMSRRGVRRSTNSG